MADTKESLRAQIAELQAKLAEAEGDTTEDTGPTSDMMTIEIDPCRRGHVCQSPFDDRPKRYMRGEVYQVGVHAGRWLLENEMLPPKPHPHAKPVFREAVVEKPDPNEDAKELLLRVVEKVAARGKNYVKYLAAAVGAADAAEEFEDFQETKAQATRGKAPEPVKDRRKAAAEKKPAKPKKAEALPKAKKAKKAKKKTKKE